MNEVVYSIEIHVKAGMDTKCSLRKHSHMFYTPSFTLLYSRKGEMRGTQNEGLFSGLD